MEEVSNDRALHVVFGFGQIGLLLVPVLLERGHRVQVVRRSGSPVPPGVELMRGDALDPAFVARATQGAAVVHHVMNPAHIADVWARELPKLMNNLVAGAGRAGARLVTLDYLYMLGRPGGRLLNESCPSNPCNRKGEIRVRVAASLFAAHASGDVRAVSGRASDCYDPRGVGTNFGEYFWKPLFAGKAAPAGNTLDLAKEFGRVLGRDIAVTQTPGVLLRIMSLFMPPLREFPEMAYQWTGPFVVDDAKFRACFSVVPTAVVNAARATVEWARDAFGK